MEKEELIAFESRIADLFNQKKIPFPVHLSGGNEDHLIDIFKTIKKGDYVFSTHRPHYHYLLAGGKPEVLEEKICRGDSMYIFDKNLHFYSSAIVGGSPGIAAGLALALKRKGSENRVWCFVGDGGEDSGHFYEAVRYVEGHDLPCTFIIEDNNLSVETPKQIRYGNYGVPWGSHVIRYHYTRTCPHVGTGTFVNFNDQQYKDERPGVSF